VVSSGPADVPSGDSCFIVIAVLVASGENNVEALDSLFGLADAAQDFFVLGPSGLEVIVDQRQGLSGRWNLLERADVDAGR